jgi:LysR family transcriptional regulator, glycine cleavage system transcriptional activator
VWFVAVGRRMSITLAAEDLCLTQSAVSRQVRALEAKLGSKLLVRGHRSISLTSEGERLFHVADAAMRELQEVVGAVRVGSVTRPVTIASSIGVAGLWLMPRLGEFLRRHPNIDVRISASNELSDLRSEEIDLTVRYCPPEAAPPGARRRRAQRPCTMQGAHSGHDMSIGAVTSHSRRACEHGKLLVCAADRTRL